FGKLGVESPRDPPKQAGGSGSNLAESAVNAMRKRMTGIKLSAETRRKMSRAHRLRGTRPPKARRPWTAKEDALIRRLPAAEVVRRTGCTLTAVYTRPIVLGAIS